MSLSLSLYIYIYMYGRVPIYIYIYIYMVATPSESRRANEWYADQVCQLWVGIFSDTHQNRKDTRDTGMPTGYAD